MAVHLKRMENAESQEQGREELQKLFCPNCGSVDVRMSQSHRTLDSLLQSFSLRPYRCRSCRKRFYKRAPAEPDQMDDHAGLENSSGEHTH
jgi:hypothetical protein